MVQGLARAIERTTNLIKFSHNLRIIESLIRNSEDNLIPNKKCPICGKIKYFEHIIGGGGGWGGTIWSIDNPHNPHKY